MYEAINDGRRTIRSQTPLAISRLIADHHHRTGRHLLRSAIRRQPFRGDQTPVTESLLDVKSMERRRRRCRSSTAASSTRDGCCQTVDDLDNKTRMTNTRATVGRRKALIFLLIVTLYYLCIGTLAADAAVSGLIRTPSSDETLLRRKNGASYKKVFTNQWAVQIVNATDELADSIANRFGFTNHGRIVGNYFLFISDRMLRKRSTRRARHLQMELGREPRVLWLEQQIAKRRVKRDFIQLSVESVDENRIHHRSRRTQPCQDGQPTTGGDCPDLTEAASDQSRLRRQYFDDFRHLAAVGDPSNVLGPFNENGGKTRQPAINISPNDPEWSRMWYLNRGFGLDHNVKEAWQLGVTGRDVVVTILDDGLEATHPDIAQNYDQQASYDINDRDTDPMPRYDMTNENRHGTRCAGEVAAVYNNSLCIVGIAFGAKIGGIRMLDGEVTDAVEAASLSHNRDHIDIYSASWGPDDDGKTVDGPARMAEKAFREGIELGRNGKGSIFVWASGNGGRDADSCNCDGYTNSIYTLSISSATEKGNVPWYSEACSSTLASTYSSGSHDEKMVVTTDLHHGCTNSHTGTSASAPLAAAICALTLEANPALTWRDLQHIVVRTARSEFLKANDWVTNGVSRNVSHSFGFGLMDAGAMVHLARNWTLAPPQKRCSVTYDGGFKQVPKHTTLQVTLEADGCAGSDSDNHVVFLEHVQAKITLQSQKRGDIQIFLTSPHGTKSTLLAKRVRDASKSGFREWAFMTTHAWGETAGGHWRLEVQNDGWTEATLLKWELILHGTSTFVGPFGGMDGRPSVTNNHVPRSEGSLWMGSRTFEYSGIGGSCCLRTPFGLCAVCSSGYALLRNSCVEKCPSHYYTSRRPIRAQNGSAEYAECRLCHSSCVDCTGPDADQCLTCVLGYEMSNSSAECLRRLHPLKSLILQRHNQTLQLMRNLTELGGEDPAPRCGEPKSAADVNREVQVELVNTDNNHRMELDGGPEVVSDEGRVVKEVDQGGSVGSTISGKRQFVFLGVTVVLVMVTAAVLTAVHQCYMTNRALRAINKRYQQNGVFGSRYRPRRDPRSNTMSYSLHGPIESEYI